MKKRTAKVFAMTIASLFVLSAPGQPVTRQVQGRQPVQPAQPIQQSPRQPANRRAAIILRML